MGKAIPLRVRSRRARAPKVVKQMGRLALLTSPCGGQCADREEKRVAHGNEIDRQQGKKQEQLDFRDPNQRRSSLTSGTPIREGLSKTATAADSCVCAVTTRCPAT
jgi:hypothetical protein